MGHILAAASKQVLENPAMTENQIQLSNFLEREHPNLLSRATDPNLTPQSKAALRAVFVGRTLSTMRQHGEAAIERASNSTTREDDE